MNYTKIKKTALLFSIQASFLSATTITSLPTTTSGKVDLIFKNFKTIYQHQESMKSADIATSKRLKDQINILKNRTIDLVSLDNKIINQTNPKGHHETVLIRAAERGYEDMIKILLKRNGVNINYTDDNGYTALMHAAKNHHYHIMYLLFNHSKDINLTTQTVRKKSALDLANESNTNNPEAKRRTLNFLKSALATKNLSTLFQPWIQPKSIAAEAPTTKSNINIIHKIFDAIEIQIDENITSDTSLNTNIVIQRKEMTEIISYDKNIINQRDPNPNGLDEPLLVRAAALGYTDIIKILLGRNANVNSSDRDKETALMMAAMYYHYNVVELLLEEKANALLVNKKGETALFIASKIYEETLSVEQVAAKKEIIKHLKMAEETQRNAKHTWRSTAPLPNAPKPQAKVKNGFMHSTFNPQPSYSAIAPKIIKQIKAKQKICNIIFIIFFVFVLISTPSYFYVRLKT